MLDISKRKKNKKSKRILNIYLLSFILICSFLLQGCEKNNKVVNDYNPYFSSKPTYSQLNLKYTYAKIGEYPQAKIKKNELTEEIINLDYNISGVGSYGDKKILRKEYEASYEYYWVENILWRVIESCF